MKETRKTAAFIALAVVIAASVFAMCSCDFIFGGKTEAKLAVTFDESHTVYQNDGLDSIKPYLTVTYTDKDGSSFTVDDYELRGTLTVGKTTLVVKYQGLTQNCAITVVSSSQSGNNEPEMQFDVFFRADGVLVETLHYTESNKNITAPQVPSKTGYDGKWEDYTLSFGDVTVNAVYTAKQYSVTLDYNGATGNNSQKTVTVAYKQNVGDLPTPTLDGYDFLGWYEDKTLITPNTEWSTDGGSTFVARWEPALVGTPGLKYEQRSGSNSGYTVIYDSAITEANIVIPSVYEGIPVTDMAGFQVAPCVSIVIGHNITSIDQREFYGCSNLTDIIIGNGVTEIGYGAFEGCNKLANVTIGSGVKYISSNAFYQCVGLESIEIPDNVTSVASYAFYNCSNLKTITIGGGITNIGGSAFQGCSNLTGVYFGGTIEDWCNISFYESTSNPMYYASDFYIKNINDGSYNELTKIIVPEGTASINRYQFYGFNHVTSIVIPDSVTKLGIYAFANCGAVTSIELPRGIIGIAERSFWNCRSLEQIIMPETVRHIDDYAFYGCESLSSVTIPSAVIKISKYAFGNCTQLTSVYYNATVADWCGITFESNTSNPMNYAGSFFIKNLEDNGYTELISINVPDGVTSINAYQFYGFNNVTTVTIPACIINISDTAFGNCGKLKYNVYDKANYLGNEDNPYLALIKYSNTSATAVTVNDNALIIANAAFENCSKLTSVTIGSNVVAIGESAFNACTGLTSVVIPDSVISIGDKAFYNCKNLTDVTIGNSVTFVGNNVFYNCSQLNYNTLDNANYLGNDDNPYRVFCNVISNAVTELTLSEDTVVIYYSALKNCSNLTELTIPEGVITIGGYAFSGCSGLTSMVIPDSVINVGAYAFQDCTSLTSLTIGKNVESIGAGALSSMYSVMKINAIYYNGTLEDWCNVSTTALLPAGGGFYTKSDDGDDYIRLTEITIPEGVTSIGNYQFYFFSSLTSVTIPQSVIEIGNYAFSSARNLSEIIFEGTVAQWNVIEKGMDWQYRVPATKVICSDGEVSLVG